MTFRVLYNPSIKTEKQGGTEMSTIKRTGSKATENLKHKLEVLDKYKDARLKNSDIDLGRALESCMKLSEKTGEFNNMISRWVFRKESLSPTEAEIRLSDILYYITVAGIALGLNLDNILEHGSYLIDLKTPEEKLKVGDVVYFIPYPDMIGIDDLYIDFVETGVLKQVPSDYYDSYVIHCSFKPDSYTISKQDAHIFGTENEAIAYFNKYKNDKFLGDYSQCPY